MRVNGIAPSWMRCLYRRAASVSVRLRDFSSCTVKFFFLYEAFSMVVFSASLRKIGEFPGVVEEVVGSEHWAACRRYSGMDAVTPSLSVDIWCCSSRLFLPTSPVWPGQRWENICR
uniref:Uncharacterized protein n=1 Tax=Parascaris univalens TaxID=6257 RepID=A0A915B3R5_PARUN